MGVSRINYRSADRVVEVSWDDGYDAEFPSWRLRGWCPCAVCQGHFARKHVFIENEGPELEDARPVGSYGVCFVWSDGHDSGIYHFEALRSLAENGPTGPEPSRN